MRLALVTLVLFLSSLSQGQQSEAIFQQANQAYQNADYSQASELYEKLVKDNVSSAELFFNLANTYFRQNQLGRAIFNFKQALNLAPRDPDIRFNLNYAQNRVLDKIEAPLGLMDRIFFLNATFDEGETYLIFATSMTGLFLMSVLLLYRKNEYTYWAQRLSLLVFLLSDRKSVV